MEQISGVVRHRVDVDYYGLVHFNGTLYQITKKYQNNTKRLIIKKKQLINMNQLAPGNFH